MSLTLARYLPKDLDLNQAIELPEKPDFRIDETIRWATSR